MSLYGSFFVNAPSPQKTGKFYVCLMQSSPYYGGPEEGGWWGEDVTCVAYQECNTRGKAEALKNIMQADADRMTAEAKSGFERYCRDSLDAAEARGLEASDLPEVDGYATYSLEVRDEVPQPRYGSRHYE